MLPFGHVFSLPSPIKLSRIEFTLAVELAAQAAAQDELRRQLAVVTGLPANEINVDGFSLDLQIPDPVINLGGIPYEWVD